MRNDRFPVCSVVSLHTCSHSAIRMPAERRPKSRIALSRSRDGSELIQQSHAGPSSSRCRTKPTFRSERSLGLASHLIEATSVNQGPQHRDRRYLWPTAHPPSLKVKGARNISKTTNSTLLGKKSPKCSSKTLFFYLPWYLPQLDQQFP